MNTDVQIECPCPSLAQTEIKLVKLNDKESSCVIPLAHSSLGVSAEPLSCGRRKSNRKER